MFSAWASSSSSSVRADSPRGSALHSEATPTGRRGRVVGSLCSAAGTLGIVFAFCFGSPVERQAMKLMSYGIVIGVLATILVLRGNRE